MKLIACIDVASAEKGKRTILIIQDGSQIRYLDAPSFPMSFEDIAKQQEEALREQLETFQREYMGKYRIPWYLRKPSEEQEL